MSCLENPFVVAGYHGKTYFCDREIECETIINALRNGRNIVLSAPRKIGKTGLIHRVFDEMAGRNEDATIYIDIFSTQNMSDFVRMLATAVIGQLDTKPQKAWAQICRFMASLKPTLGFDALTGLPQVSVTVAEELKEQSLKDIFEYLRQSKRKCYIAIDEFQQIANYPEKGMEALLRSYIQFLPNVQFIFSGSRQHLLQEMFCSAKRPFYQSAQIISIAPIQQDTYYDFARSFFQKNGRQLPQEIFENIYQRFDGYTWYIQMLLNRLYARDRDIDIALIQEETAQIVAEYSYYYQQLQNTIPAYHAQLLRAIAAERCVTEITGGNFIQKYRLKAASSVRSALIKLLNLELVYKTSQGYIIYDRFMNEWLCGK